MPFLHQCHHTENPDRLKSSLPGSQQLGTSACHGWMVQEWPLNIWIELMKLVLQIFFFGRCCHSQKHVWVESRYFVTGCSGLLDRIDACKKDVRQPETFLFLPGQKSIMVATFPATCSWVLWDRMFHGFNQFGLLFLWLTYWCILKTWVIFCCSFFFPAISFTGRTLTVLTLH